MGSQGEGLAGGGGEGFYWGTGDRCQIGENRSEMCQEVRKLS
jgi:hypothetical protein